MKLDNGGPPGTGEQRGSNRAATGSRMTPLPVEWMDPMSWRLPSGKALAEFALQSGFLAPLMLGTPMGDGRIRRPVRKTNGPKKAVGEAPVAPGTFRDGGADQVEIGTGSVGAGQFAAGRFGAGRFGAEER